VARQDYVRDEFRPFLDRIAGHTRAPTPAANWTGRRTVRQQAQIVLAVAPNAFEAVDMLLEQQETCLGNQGPVDPERLDAIADLKKLHSALGELISLAQAGQPVLEHLRALRRMRDSTFRWSTETYELMLRQLPLYSSSAVYASALWFMINLMTKDLDASATVTAGILGATAINSRGRQGRVKPEK
jgi:hypothetical protein